MTKLTIICGPTAVGKTNFALKVAEKYDADLISVDSRQVYRGMDIGTGKDVPLDAVFTQKDSFSIGQDTYSVGYFSIQNTKIWLLDIARPNQPFSSAVYNRAFEKTVDIIGKKHPVILIGGTGYYLKSIINPPETMSIPPNQVLREKLEKNPLSSLQETLIQLDSTRFISMNHSDQANPHRLIRAIEVAISGTKPYAHESAYEVKWFGLTAPKEQLINRISQRVYQRISNNFSAEMNALLKEYPQFHSLQAGNTLGYREWGKFLSGDWTEKEATDHWINAEIQYAKRQLTWFNKQSGLVWFDITDENWYAQASEQLERWMKYGANHP